MAETDFGLVTTVQKCPITQSKVVKKAPANKVHIGFKSLGVARFLFLAFPGGLSYEGNKHKYYTVVFWSPVW
eukprot:5160962-Amphidinium_carterae.2